MTQLPALVRSLVDASLDPAAVVDTELTLLHANAPYLRLAGLSPADLGVHRGACHHQLGLEICGDRCVSRIALERQEPVTVHDVYSRHMPLRVTVTAVPLLDPAGAAYAVLEQYRDRSAESRLQETYRALLERERVEKEALAQEVARHTAALERVNESLLAALSEVSRVARTDGLTGLANRRAFDQHLRTHISAARRNNAPLALVLIDLDHFKRVNDQHGHPAGDELLKDFAAILGDAVGESALISAAAREVSNELSEPAEPHPHPLRGHGSLIARVGGEEFALVLPGCDVLKAQDIALRIRARAKDRALLTTASAGIAICPADGDDASALLRAADSALYAAKRGGRDRAVCATRRDD